MHTVTPLAVQTARALGVRGACLRFRHLSFFTIASGDARPSMTFSWLLRKQSGAAISRCQAELYVMTNARVRLSLSTVQSLCLR